MAEHEFNIINNEQLEAIEKGFSAADQILINKTNLLIISCIPEIQANKELSPTSLRELKRLKGLKETLNVLLTELKYDLQYRPSIVVDLPVMPENLSGGHGIRE